MASLAYIVSAPPPNKQKMTKVGPAIYILVFSEFLDTDEPKPPTAGRRTATKSSYYSAALTSLKKSYQ